MVMFKDAPAVWDNFRQLMEGPLKMLKNTFYFKNIF